MSIASFSRLWLGAEVNRSRGGDLISAMMTHTARCCTGKVLLVPSFTIFSIAHNS
ncbi:MAG: hypothetical protein HQK72_16255 [Desulfamplus sp.]|nr:hypothetical protein [Desulfamplus sp.]